MLQEIKHIAKAILVTGAIGIAALGIGVLASYAVPAAAATVCQVFNGCTGTSTTPTLGQVLVGQSNGTYGPQATSTLGITGGGGISLGLITDYHSDGTITVTNATTSGQLGNGTALLTAFSAGVNGDSFKLASSTYDIGTANIDLSKGCTGSISIYGSGKYNTQIIANHGGGDATIVAATNSITADLGIIATSTANLALPWGSKSCQVTNATLRNVYTNAQSDGIYFQNFNNPGKTIANIYSSDINSAWDTVFLFESGTMNIYDSSLTPTGNVAVNGGLVTHGVFQKDGQINLYNTNITATNDTENDGVFESGGHIFISGGAISTSGGTTNYDLYRDVGLISVTANTVYDITKTGGPITHADNGQIRASLGSNGASSTALINENGVANWENTSSITNWVASGNNIYNLNQGGNVGINTTSPGLALDVNGHIGNSHGPTGIETGGGTTLVMDDSTGFKYQDGGNGLDFNIDLTGLDFLIDPNAGIVTDTADMVVNGMGTFGNLGDQALTNKSCIGTNSIGTFITGTCSGGTGNVSTSTSETAGSLAYWTTNSGTPAKLGQVATSSIGAANGISFSGTAGYQIGGTIGTYGLTAIAAGTLLGNQTSGSAVPSAIATSTLFGTPTPGFVLAFVGGKWQGVASTTFSAPLSYLNGAVSCPTCLTANQSITLSGDVSGSGATSISTTLATVNTNTGTWGSSSAIPNFTVNGKGLITAAGTNAVIAPAGTLSGSTLNSGVTASSLTSVGSLTALTVSGNITSNITGGGTQCVQVNNSGVLSGTGSDCGSGGGSGGNSKLATSTNLVSLHPNGGNNIALTLGEAATTTNSLLEITGTTTSNTLEVSGCTSLGSNSGNCPATEKVHIFGGNIGIDNNQNYDGKTAGGASVGLIGINSSNYTVIQSPSISGGLQFLSSVGSAVNGTMTDAGLWELGQGSSTPGTILSIPTVANLASATSTFYSALKLPYLSATSTSIASQITLASTTAISATSVCLTGDVCRTTWPSGSPGGSNSQIQYNNSGAFGGMSNFTNSSGNPNILAAGQLLYNGVNGLYASTTAMIYCIANASCNISNIPSHTATDITAIGDSVLNSMTNASQDVGIGYLALASCTTCSGSIAIGNRSELNLVSGTSDFGMGVGALQGANGASSNDTVVGVSSLQGSGVINEDTVIGSGSFGNATGGDNVGIGYRVGNGMTTGTNNVLIGKDSGSFPNNMNGMAMTTASNDTFVGFQTGFANSSQITNASSFGYQSTVGASNALVLGGTYLNAVNVGIGTTSPWGILSIATTTNPGMPFITVASSTTGTATTTIFAITQNGTIQTNYSGVVKLSSGVSAVSPGKGALIDSGTIIFLTPQSACTGFPDITATTTSSFTITSTVLTDTCMVGWEMIEHN